MEPKQVVMNDDNTICREVMVNLENGLHLVPCSRIAEVARESDCEIRIRKDDQLVDAKTIFDLMTLRAGQGTALELIAEGPGAHAAMERLVELFENDFFVDRS